MMKPPTDDLNHDAAVLAEHVKLTQRTNEIKLYSVVLEEAAEEIVDLRAALTAAEATRHLLAQERDSLHTLATKWQHKAHDWSVQNAELRNALRACEASRLEKL